MTEPLKLAHLLHRVSGLLLALFLPVHFWVLALVLTDNLDQALSFTSNPVVKAMEAGLVFLLAVHMFGGLRFMALEFLPWRPAQKTLAALAAAGGFLVAALFLIQAI